jgi:hypothetical protein
MKEWQITKDNAYILWLDPDSSTHLEKQEKK